MKKVLLCFVALFAIFCFAACSGEDDTFEIAFVTDVGQLMDKSFNQGTWEGVKAFADEKGKTCKYYQPANGNDANDDDRYNAMKAAVDNGAKVVVCAGFMQGNALEDAATEYPEIKFIFVDGWAIGKDNVTAVVFKEEQSGYLAGYAAVMEGYTKLGFAGGGGGNNPACQRFGYGYLQGANAAAVEKSITVDMKFSWNYGSDFSASPELQTMLEGWYNSGTEVVFACGGSMCNSAFTAASANNGKVIGVDVDQSSQSPTVITSAMKGLQAGTKFALAGVYNGKWDSEFANKTHNLGAAEDAIGLPTATWKMNTFTKDMYNTLLNKLKDNSVVVSTDVENTEKEYSNVNTDFIK